MPIFHVKSVKIYIVRASVTNMRYEHKGRRMMIAMMIAMLILEHKGRPMMITMMIAMMIAMMITKLILEHKSRPPHPTQASGSDPLEKMFAQFLFHYFLCIFQKLNIFCVVTLNALCQVF